MPYTYLGHLYVRVTLSPQKMHTPSAPSLVSPVAGVVMGCPSDSPDDYTALNELKAKPAFRQKFQVQDAWVEFDVSDMAVTA